MKARHIISIFIIQFFFALAPAQHFLHNVEEAASLAQNENKRILLVFTGSDWCKPCILLKREMLSAPAFSAFSEQELVLVNLDFPYKKANRLPKEQQAYNDQQAERYNPDGQFPRTLLLDQQKNVIREIYYKPGMSTEDFIRQVQDAS